jgi:hypothetical protein
MAIVPIVFIHIGGAPPDYAAVAVRQARRWNPDAPIVFLSSVLGDYGVGEKWVPIADIALTANHAKFRSSTTLNATWRGGFWRSTTERLFILEDWMRSAGVAECIHMENDNMLYTNISELLPALRTGAGISTTFQGQGSTLDQVRMCFSLLYCKSVDALGNFLFTLAGRAEATDEMQRGGQYWFDTPEECSVLPTAPTGVKLVSESFRAWYEDPRFPCLFDASAHGQFLGGEDPRNGPKGPGFVNLDTDFRTDQFLYGWRADAIGRRYPVLMDSGGQEWHIVNLHIHCKRLADFI